MYATRSDVELEFGRTNIEKWANAENDGTYDVNAAIDRAIELAEADLNDMFRGGRYSVPLVLGSGSAIVIKDYVVVAAGWKLYTKKGLRDKSSERVRMERKLEMVKKTIVAYLTGERQLDAQLESYRHIRVPTVIGD